MTLFRITLLCTLSLLTGCSQLATFASEVSGLSLLHDRRHSDAIINDEMIEQRATMNLLSDKPLFTHAHINVTAYNGAILATGEVPTLNLHKKLLRSYGLFLGLNLFTTTLEPRNPALFMPVIVIALLLRKSNLT
jgi:Predicted periplasmic or secreted lipoprotein